MVRKTVSQHQNAHVALNARKFSIKSRAPVPVTANARATVRKHLAEITQDNIAASPAEIGTDEYAQSVPAQSAEQLAACAAEGFSGTVEVVLTLSDGEKLGFSIAGGSDGGGNIESSSPIYIKQMLVDGAAHRDGRLRAGDYFLSINGASLEGKEHSEVVGLIAAATNAAGRVSIKVWREALPTNETAGNASTNQSMNLSTMADSGDASNLVATPTATPTAADRTFTGGSTFSLVGGADTGTGLFITNAQLPNQDIRAGDELLAICGVSTNGMAVAQALDLIHEADAENRLQLEVAENAIGFAKLAEIMHNSQDSIQPGGTPIRPVRVGVLTPINSVKSQRRNPITPAVTPAATPKMTSSRLSTRLSSEGQIDVFPMASFEDAMPNPPFFTRASFAFDAKSFENGISFQATDILEVLEFTDDNTWIGHHIDTGNIGEIPSATFAQRYILLQQQQAVGNQSAPTPKAAYEIVFKQRVDDLLENPNATRPVAIFGANVDDIAGQMVAIAGDELDVCHPTFHTTRAPRDGEVDGVDYHYITDPAMKQGLAAKLFVEAGTFESQVYALSLADIVNSSRQGKTVLLQTKIKAVGRLLSSTGLRPVVVFVEPAQGLSAELQEFKETYRGSFTHTIMASATIGETAQSVLRTIRASVKKPYWIRAGQPILSSSSDCPETLDFSTNCCANKNADSAASATATANAAIAARGRASVVRKKWVAPITTRPRRDNETDGKQYHFLTKEDFKLMIDGEKLQEWGTFNGEFYGVARADNVSKAKPLLRSKTLVTALLESGHQMKDKGLNPASGKTQSLKVRPTQSMKDKLADRRRTAPPNQPARHHSLKEKLAFRRGQKAASSNDMRSAEVPDDASDPDNDTAGSDYSSTCSPVDFMPGVMPRSFLNEVTLVRNNAGSFGFTLTGGVDYGDLPSISRINNVSTVESTLCDLAVGDNILAINGVCLANATHDSTINLLRNSTDMLTLVLFPSEGSDSMPSSSFLLGAELTQGETGVNGFGFTTVSMAGDTPGVVIREVARGSDAEREHLSAGMHVLTVNGIDVSAGSIERVETLLTKGSTASLVARGTIVSNPALQMSRRQRHDSIMSAYDPSMMTAEPVILQKTVTMNKDQGSFGMRLGVDKFGITRVLNVTPGTPAEGVVEIDDQIVSINGIEASGDTRKDALQQLVSCSVVELDILYQGELQEAPFVDLNDSALVNVEFERHEGEGLGIEIAAMPETGIYVHRLVDGGIAAGDGRIQEGDIILEVNGRPVYDQSTDEIMNWFILNQVISIKLLRSQMNETHSITINRDSDQSLGLKIILTSIVTVASIVPGSLADLAGVPAGCQLLKVNNVSLDGKSYKEIRALLCQNSKLELEVAAH